MRNTGIYKTYTKLQQTEHLIIIVLSIIIGFIAGFGAVGVRLLILTITNLSFPRGISLHSQSAIFTLSDIPFAWAAIAAECTPNIEMLIFEDLDLSLLKGVRHSGSVLNLKDKRKDIYELLHYKDGKY